MSAISASSMPQPTAAPLTAAITGTSVREQRAGGGREPRLRRRAVPRLASPAAAMTCFTSSPEQNAGSAPVMTRQRAVVVSHGLGELGVGRARRARCAPRAGRA